MCRGVNIMIKDTHSLDDYPHENFPEVPVFNADELSLDPGAVINADGEMTIVEFSIISKQDS